MMVPVSWLGPLLSLVGKLPAWTGARVEWSGMCGLSFPFHEVQRCQDPRARQGDEERHSACAGV